MTDEHIVEATPDEAPSMDDTIRNTLAEINARDSEEITTEPEAVEETAEEKAERQRDEKGRFAANEAEAVAESETPVETPQDVVLSPEVQRLGLRKEEAAEWAKASPVLQQALLRRSEEMHRGLEQYRGAAQFASQMAEAFQPYQQTLQQLGVTPDVAVSKLLAADNTLRNGSPEQKAYAIQSLIQQYGVDLQAMNNLPQVDPQVYALQSKINQLEGYFSNLQREQSQREEATLNSEIAKFSEGREHFNEVREDMAALLQAGRAKDLSDAYEQAIWANPTIRTQLLAKQQAEAVSKLETDRKAQDARRSASVNIPRRGTVPATPSTGTMEDTIRATAQKLGLFPN